MEKTKRVLVNEKKKGKIDYFHFSFSCLSEPNIIVSYSFSFQFECQFT